MLSNTTISFALQIYGRWSNHKDFLTKIYRLLRFGFSTQLLYDQQVLHPSVKNMRLRNTIAMDIGSDLKLTMYNDINIMMNDVSFILIYFQEQFYTHIK